MKNIWAVAGVAMMAMVLAMSEETVPPDKEPPFKPGEHSACTLKLAHLKNEPAVNSVVSLPDYFLL